MDTKELINELTERIQRTANVRAVFGDPIREGSVTLIPVARVVVRGGVGAGRDRRLPSRDDRPGGQGDRRPEPGSGMGLGLNIITSPVGYIKVSDGSAEFQPVIDRNKAVMVISIAAAIGLWATSAMLRSLKP